MDPIQQILVPFVVLLIALTFHEAAHALVAKWGGDLTAYNGGQVTLNPIPHIQREPIGTVVLPLVALVSTGGSLCIGFAHAPVDPLWMHRHPKKASLMALAGPAANVLLAAIALLGLFLLIQVDAVRPGVFGKLEPMEPSGWKFAAHLFLEWTLKLNILLALFNLVPWPPLDGATALEGFVPQVRGPYQVIRSQPILALLGALLIANFVVIRLFFWDTYYAALDLIR